MSTNRRSVKWWFIVAAMLLASMGDVRAQDSPANPFDVQPKPKVTDNPIPVTQGIGVNSDAGATGRVVLKDKAAQTTLEASELTIELSEVLNLGVGIGETAALVQHSDPNTNIFVRLVASSVVVQDIKPLHMSDEGVPYAEVVTLKLTA